MQVLFIEKVEPREARRKKMEKIIKNGTPHAINVVDDAGNIVRVLNPDLPSGQQPRCTANSVVVGDVDGIPLTKTVYGEVFNLPEYEEGVFWIVSQLCRNARPERGDLLSPSQQIRDKEGKIIGCKSFDGNF